MDRTIDPDEKLDFDFDFKALSHGYVDPVTGEPATSDWLAEGETITAFTVTATTGLTIGAPSPATSQADGKVTYWVHSGVAGSDVTVTCRITTSAGRVKERCVRLYVRDC